MSTLEVGGTALGSAQSEKGGQESAHGGVFEQVSFVSRLRGKITDVEMHSLKAPSPASRDNSSGSPRQTGASLETAAPGQPDCE